MFRYLAAIALLIVLFAVPAALLGSVLGGVIIAGFCAPLWMLPILPSTDADLA